MLLPKKKKKKVSSSTDIYQPNVTLGLSKTKFGMKN